MWTEQDIQRVRDISIAEQFGVQRGRRVKINCPFPDHNSDSTPSFLIDENNGYKCFGCGKYGNNFIDFCTEILREQGKDESKIFSEIMKEYGSSNNQRDLSG